MYLNFKQKFQSNNYYFSGRSRGVPLSYLFRVNWRNAQKQNGSLPGNKSYRKYFFFSQMNMQSVFKIIKLTVCSALCKEII
ncbi:hypothetical protein FKM82_024975 [Ascaphus truei]